MEAYRNPKSHVSQTLCETSSTSCRSTLPRRISRTCVTFCSTNCSKTPKLSGWAVRLKEGGPSTPVRSDDLCPLEARTALVCILRMRRKQPSLMMRYKLGIESDL